MKLIAAIKDSDRRCVHSLRCKYREAALQFATEVRVKSIQTKSHPLANLQLGTKGFLFDPFLDFSSIGSCSAPTVLTLVCTMKQVQHTQVSYSLWGFHYPYSGNQATCTFACKRESLQHQKGKTTICFTKYVVIKPIIQITIITINLDY